MKQAYFLLLLLLCCFTASAQAVFATVEVPVKSAHELVPSVNESGDVCLYYFQRGKCYYTTINADGQLVGTDVQPQLYESPPQVLSSLPLPDRFIYFKRVANSNEILQPVSVDKATGALTIKKDVKPALDPGSKFVTAFTDSASFYAFYFSKKTNTLQVCIFSDEQEHVVKRFQPDLPQMQQRLFGNGAPVYIDAKAETSMKDAQSLKKLYKRGEKLFFVFDAFDAHGNTRTILNTDILELDLASQTSRFTQLPFYQYLHPTAMNSYLHQNTLFRFVLTKEVIALVAYDLHTQQVKKEYVYNTDDMVTLKATPLLRKDDKKKLSDTTTVEPTKKLFKKMTNGQTFVLADAVSPNVVQLSLGVYKYNNGGPIAPVAGGAGPGTMMVGGGMRMPADLTTYFNTSLDGNTFESKRRRNTRRTVDAAEEHRAFSFELSQDYVTGGNAVGTYTIYPYLGRLHYAYLDRATKQIRVLSFVKPSSILSSRKN